MKVSKLSVCTATCCLLWFIVASIFAGVFGWSFHNWKKEPEEPALAITTTDRIRPCDTFIVGSTSSISYEVADEPDCLASVMVPAPHYCGFSFDDQSNTCTLYKGSSCTCSASSSRRVLGSHKATHVKPALPCPNGINVFVSDNETTILQWNDTLAEYTDAYTTGGGVSARFGANFVNDGSTLYTLDKVIFETPYTAYSLEREGSNAFVGRGVCNHPCPYPYNLTKTATLLFRCV